MKEMLKKKNKSFDKKINKNYRGASFSLSEVIVIILMTALIVSICSGVVVYSNYDKIHEDDTKNLSGLEEFTDAYNRIVTSYVDGVDEEKLVNSAIEGMLNYLEDTNSSYLDEDSTQSLQERLEGEYQGIGVEITSNGEYIVVATVFANTPAAKAGLKVGDIITSINGTSMKGKTAAYLSSLIKELETDIKIKYTRSGKEYNTTISINNITIPSVSSKMYDKIGYIKIETFAANTYYQFKSELEKLEKKGMKKLVIDVRNNTGGYLAMAYKMADLFVGSNKVIYQLKDKSGNIEVHKSQDNETRKYSIAILVNGASASASEILAAALKDNNKAVLIGTTTYGKGTVQETDQLSSGSMIKYTTAYWLTPKGVCIDGLGLTPDYEVTLTDTGDAQLNKALKILK